jgi:Mg2+/citrate symporter
VSIWESEKESGVCMRCASPLSYDEIGLYKKLINRASKSFLCIKCLALELNVSEENLRARIELFRKQGCTLFL